MKAKGKIKIEKGLELNNPYLEILSSNYDWTRNTVTVECIFNEEGSIFKHSRSYIFELEIDREYSINDIISLISSHEVLKVFK